MLGYILISMFYELWLKFQVFLFSVIGIGVNSLIRCCVSVGEFGVG